MMTFISPQKKKKHFVQTSSGLPLSLSVYPGGLPSVNLDRYELGGQLYTLQQLQSLGIEPKTRKKYDEDWQ